jgi:hypothetical protein
MGREQCKAADSAESDVLTFFDGHRLGIRDLVPGDPFEYCEDTSIIILVTPHRQSAIGVVTAPCQADEEFLRLAEGIISPVIVHVLLA